VCYTNKYGHLAIKADTTIYTGKLCRVYSAGTLQKIGGLHNNRRRGYWFVFDNSLQTDYVLKYRHNNIIDSFDHPFSIIDRPWHF